MNCDTGEIFKTPQGLEDFIKSIPIVERPVFGFAELGNMPAQGCDKCKSTGVARILPGGRRIPCACTNPK